MRYYSVQMEHQCIESKPDPVQIASMTRPLPDHALRGRQHQHTSLQTPSARILIKENKFDKVLLYIYNMIIDSIRLTRHTHSPIARLLTLVTGLSTWSLASCMPPHTTRC
jgi:hypothetical protein